MTSTIDRLPRERRLEQGALSQGNHIPQSARVKALIAELDRPLEEAHWARSQGQQDIGSAALVDRLREQEQHQKDLERARRAAASVFRVRPKLSARKRASLMMGAGAMTLGAFTAPPSVHYSGPSLTEIGAPIDPADEMRQPAGKLTVSNDFKQALIEEEGVRYTVYRDVAGYPTVGVGHLVRPADNLRVGDRISDQQVLDFLDDDLRTAEAGVRHLVGDLRLAQHEFDALVDLVYNVGLGNVSESKSPRLNAAINAGDYDGIAAELEYRHAGGKVARGLEFRSERRAQMFADASYDDPREAIISQS